MADYLGCEELIDQVVEKLKGMTNTNNVLKAKIVASLVRLQHFEEWCSHLQESYAALSPTQVQ